MKRVIAVVIIGFALVGCTPRELSLWKDWYEKDPVAATEFANRPEVQEDLHGADTSSDGPQFQYRQRWDDIAWCESGGRWDYPPVTNRTGTYSGGLMIWTKAWIAYGGQQFANQAWQATKQQQIVVAERILADRGWGAWDCA
jgi:resuscitation-promoting factor RpfB